MAIKPFLQGTIQCLVRRYLGPFWYRRHWLNKTQWGGKEDIEAIQLALLKRLVRHAEKHVPYYRALMKQHGFTINDIRSLGDIQRFPVLTKRNVIDAGDALLSRCYPKKFLRHAFTGGTTGTPLHLYRSLSSIGNEHAFVRRQWDWAGLGFRDVCAFVKGRVITSASDYVYDPIMKELHLSTYQLNIESAKRYLSIIERHNCKGLVGYPSSVFLLAKAKNEMKITLPLRSILLTSETLTAETKEYISNAFGVDIYDYYGAAERVSYIFTCEEGRYHVQPEYGLTEFLSSSETSQKIISTGFWNLAMPLIRYDTGDKVILSDTKCLCGREFPVVDQICGREGDYLRTPSGKILGVSILTHTFHVICGIDCFVESQIIQDRIDHLTINYVPSIKFRKENIIDYSQKLKKVVGQEMEVDFVQVENIEKTSSGKHKFIVSRIQD